MTERKITKSDCKYYRESDGNCLNFTYVGEYDPCTDGDLEHCYEKFPHFFNKVERMIAKRFIPIFDGTDKRVVGAKDNGKIISFMDMFDLLNDLSDENEQLKQYKQSVNDVLKSWSQKNLTAKQLQVVLTIMEELNVIGDVE